MLTFTEIAPAPGAAPAGALELWLVHAERARRRQALMLPDGTAVALLLPRGAALADGTWLRAADGRLACVRAAPEPLLRIAAAEPRALLRVVYHLANRHVAMQIAADQVLVEADPVLERLARQLGARVAAVVQPFEPEAGAYHGHADAHGHAHGHGHALDEAAALGEQLSIEAHARRRADPDT